MKRIIKVFIILLVVAVLTVAVIIVWRLRNNEISQSDINKASLIVKDERAHPMAIENLRNGEYPIDDFVIEEDSTKQNPTTPLDRLTDRLTKKSFADYITPENSPVQPEKFSGYHTGIDLEILPGEENQEVVVKTICQGPLVYKNWISGYGGTAVQQCELKNQTVTVIYGHLNLSSINRRVGEILNFNDILGNLGQGYSTEIDGERKHLHLGIHKGKEIELRGYVQKQAELNDWLNPLELLD